MDYMGRSNAMIRNPGQKKYSIRLTEKSRRRVGL